MLEDLTRYYTDRGIAAQAFKCRHQADCSRGAVDFVSAREAFVGSEYEKGTLPRLLFVSLDPANDVVGRSSDDRTIFAVRDWETRQPRPASGGHPKFKKQAHWYQTYEFTHRLLAPIARVRGMGPLSFSEMYKYFAHTNSAKCKDAAAGTGQGPERVFENCREFIPGEVEVLRPDIVVTQGKYARESIAGAFELLLVGVAPSPEYRAEVVAVGSRPVLKFETHHPNRKDSEYGQEVAGAWRWYARVASTFAEGGTPALMSEHGFGEA